MKSLNEFLNEKVESAEVDDGVFRVESRDGRSSAAITFGPDGIISVEVTDGRLNSYTVPENERKQFTDKAKIAMLKKRK